MVNIYLKIQQISDWFLLINGRNLRIIMVKTINTGRWTSEEHRKFVIAREKKLKWEQTADLIGTRTADQCRSHNQKMKIQKINNKTNWLFNYNLKMVDKSTQYEVPPSVYADRPVYTKTFEFDSPNTNDSNHSDCQYDFEYTEQDYCDTFLA